MRDPTRSEMLEFLTDPANVSGCDEFDIEEAIYWFASDWHRGQASNLYSVLSTSPFNPGPTANGPSESARELYYLLEEEYT